MSNDEIICRFVDTNNNINGTVLLRNDDIISTELPSDTEPISAEIVNDTVTMHTDIVENEAIPTNIDNVIINNVGTNDHNQLINRNLPNQHNISAINGLTEAISSKQDKLTSANAGSNVTITEVSGVVKINAIGGSGTGDYNALINKPQINNTELIGNKSLSDLGIINDKSFIHEQNVAMNTWTIQHNLNKYPSVAVVDNNNNIIDGSVEYIDSNSLTVKFNATFRGKAYLN